MSLESAKLIRLDEAGNQCETIVANGRKLTLGYYMSCDYVLTDPRAKGVHCEIECDALGRVGFIFSYLFMSKFFKLNFFSLIFNFVHCYWFYILCRYSSTIFAKSIPSI